ncbi:MULTISPECIES: PDR/VanB family oxidoreductase [Psychrobacter]|uniref:PDR/VanB family oxidoreductase n=1 Tax=Psychrobacter TaxID=497 RepID=UPI00146BB9D9|nr:MULTISPECIES: PDR/VanB family oxidoreductase [Psychrobacter]
MSENYQMFASIVTKVEPLNPRVKRFTFQRADGQPYPPFTAGSHIFVKTNEDFSNAYSLVSATDDLSQYQVCVQREDTGKGGSVFMHDHCVEGFKLEISSPNNLFELCPSDQKHLLVAGGIGVTPFITYMEKLAQLNANYELHYGYRTPDYAHLLSHLDDRVFADHVKTYDGQDGVCLDLESLISEQPIGTHIYVCGPKPMIDATIEACHKYQHHEDNIHWEQFAPITTENGNAFTVILAKSDLTIEVQPEQTILQAIESFNIEVECLCREGVCGTCETAILKGEAEHLDQYLDEDEKAAQNTMMICVSRARGNEITLDL